MAQIGSLLVISDAGCGVVFLKAALESGMLNVTINLGIIKDQAYTDSAREEMNRLLEDGRKIADETLALVISKL
jgi:formiminotetrahydrofolate cyclodeaminase